MIQSIQINACTLQQMPCSVTEGTVASWVPVGGAWNPASEEQVYAEMGLQVCVCSPGKLEAQEGAQAAAGTCTSGAELLLPQVLWLPTQGPSCLDRPSSR